MTIGSGLSASLGIASETTYGTPVPVILFTEFDTSSMALKKHTYTGKGIRGGNRVAQAGRRIITSREAGGDASFDVPDRGFATWLKHALGSVPTATASGSLTKLVFSPGGLNGLSFTTQIVKPDTNGDLALNAFTYPGCKITAWELSAQLNEVAKFKPTIDARDSVPAASGATVQSGTVVTASTAGASSIVLSVQFPTGTYVVVGAPGSEEVFVTGTATGSAGSYTTPVANALTSTSGASSLAFAHAVGAPVSVALATTYGTPATMQTPTYPATIANYAFARASFVVGGSTAQVSGVWTNTGGVPLADVKSISLKGTNPVKTDRIPAGSLLKNEPKDNGWADFTLEVEADYDNQLLVAAYEADLPLTLQVQDFASPLGATLDIYAPAGFLNDGAEPTIDGPDILTQKLAFDILDDGVNGYLQAVLTSTDATA